VLVHLGLHGQGPQLKEIVMQRIGVPLVLAAAWLAGAREGTAQTQPQAPPLRVTASTLASVELHVNSRKAGGQWYAEDAGLSGPSRIAITYGQPHARGRRVVGGLIPVDTVWRFGANMATSLHTDVDFRLGDLKVPQGDYSLFVLYTRAGWQLIVNRGTGQWGTDYDASKDLGRVPLTARTLGDPEETLAIFLVPDASPGSGAADLKGAMRIKWGTVELSARWQVEP
jgi:hypothetical protein